MGDEKVPEDMKPKNRISFRAILLICGFVVAFIVFLAFGIIFGINHTSVPSTPTFDPALARTPQVVVENQAHPNSLAVDDQAIYWTNCGTKPGDSNDGTVMSFSKTLHVIKTLAAGFRCPLSLAADASTLYWIDRTADAEVHDIYSMLKSGSEPVLLASRKNMGEILAADESYIYWKEWNGSQYLTMRMGKIGGTPPEQAPVNSMVFAGSDIYGVNEDQDIFRAGREGSSSQILLKASDSIGVRSVEISPGRNLTKSIGQIFPGSAYIYFTVYVDGNPGMVSCSDQHTVLKRWPVNGGTVEEVAQAPGFASAWVTENSAFISGMACGTGVIRVNLNSKQTEIIAAYPESAWSFAEDDHYVYWTDWDKSWIKQVGK